VMKQERRARSSLRSQLTRRRTAGGVRQEGAKENCLLQRRSGPICLDRDLDQPRLIE